MTKDETVRLWRMDGRGDRLLTELSRSMFSSDDDFQLAIEFHEERGCKLVADELGKAMK